MSDQSQYAYPSLQMQRPTNTGYARVDTDEPQQVCRHALMLCERRGIWCPSISRLTVGRVQYVQVQHAQAQYAQPYPQPQPHYSQPPQPALYSQPMYPQYHPVHPQAAVYYPPVQVVQPGQNTAASMCDVVGKPPCDDSLWQMQMVGIGITASAIALRTAASVSGTLPSFSPHHASCDPLLDRLQGSVVPMPCIGIQRVPSRVRQRGGVLDGSLYD